MALCFGASAVLLSGQWSNLRSQPSQILWQPSSIHRLEFILERSPVAARVSRTRVVIRLDRRELELYEGETRIHTFPVAIGKDEWETPIGHFTVLDLREDPVWQHPITGEAVSPGPDNPLGSRWVGFAFAPNNFRVGIHGTYAEELVGEAVSHGCVRMRDRDIQTLFAYLSIGTPISVRPQ